MKKTFKFMPIVAAIGLLFAFVACSGCSLNHQVPKATISFNRATHQIEIASAKDVTLSNVVAVFVGTNASISIGYYKASYNIDVVNAAIQSQKQQIEGIQGGLEKVIGAAISAAK